MRNNIFPLTSEENQIASMYRDEIVISASVAVSYVKRPAKGQTVGEPGEARGTIVSKSGSEGFTNESFTVDTTATKGRPTTINTYNVRAIVPLFETL